MSPEPHRPEPVAELPRFAQRNRGHGLGPLSSDGSGVSRATGHSDPCSDHDATPIGGSLVGTI